MEPSTLSSAISVVPGGVTAPAGFRTAGVHCGIKARAGALDLMLLVADGSAAAAGAFTIRLAPQRRSGVEGHLPAGAEGCAMVTAVAPTRQATAGHTWTR